MSWTTDKRFGRRGGRFVPWTPPAGPEPDDTEQSDELTPAPACEQLKLFDDDGCAT
jgi:hypothetical protein